MFRLVIECGTVHPTSGPVCPMKDQRNMSFAHNIFWRGLRPKALFPVVCYWPDGELDAALRASTDDRTAIHFCEYWGAA
jgi:hypothetical protein